MNNTGAMILLALLSLALGALIGTQLTYSLTMTSMKEDAIQNECARYNPTTGEFE